MNSMNGASGYGGSGSSYKDRLSSGGSPKFSGDKIPKGYKAGQLQQFTPEQMQLLQSLYPYLEEGSYLQRLASGDQSMFDEMEAPALRQFSGTIGGLANRFATGSGKNSLGNLRSSGFQNTGSAAASNFAQELQANRQNLTRQAQKDLFGLSNELFSQRPYERTLTKKPEKESSGWGGLIGAGLGATGGFLAGGPAAAFAGGKLGYDIGSGF